LGNRWANILTRTRSGADERKVIVSLTEKGKEMRIQAATIPEELVKNLKTDSLKVEDLITLRSTLNNLIDFLIEKDGNF
jgi:DNA-binding MarR family transcriptional regulator